MLRSDRSILKLDSMKTFKNFIAGAWVEPATGEYFDNINPADTSDVIGRFPLSAREDVDGRSRRRKRGFERWRRTPAPARGDVLRRVGDISSERKDEIADLMTREMGKPLTETRGDVQEGIDTAYYAATEGRRLFGHTVPSELRDKWAMSFRRPVGCGGHHHAVQLSAGDPHVEDLSRAALRERGASSSRRKTCRTRATVFVEVLLEAGLPPEVIQLVHGTGEDVGARDRRAPGRLAGLVHRLDRNGAHRRRDVRAAAQAPLARDGRQERDDRAR